MKNAVVLLDTPTFRTLRTRRHVITEFATPHRVISTSFVNGGIQEKLTHLLNHQSCEASGHDERFATIMDLGQEDYHHRTCKEIGIDGDLTASMGTAANVQYTALGEAAYEEFLVHAIVTAGVAGNAGRVGDPARYVERDGAFEAITQNGTINIILLFDTALSIVALTRAVMTMTEAKSAVLQELAVRSKYATGIATGTGTDQFCIAAPMISSGKPLTWTGKHSKIGELIGNAVMDATKDALRWQNGMELSYLRNVFHPLSAFGFKEDFFKRRLKAVLNGSELELIMKNYKSVVFEPQVAAAAYALAAIKDRAAVGVLPPSSATDAILNQCAVLASTLAAKPEEYAQMRRQLTAFATGEFGELVFRAIILGWRNKWND